MEPWLDWLRNTWGTTDIQIWRRDRYDQQWRCWYPLAATDADPLAPGWLDDEILGSSMMMSNNIQTLSFSIELLDHCEIRVVLPEGIIASTDQCMLLEYLIRDTLMKEQIAIERAHHEHWLGGLRELTSSLDLNNLLFKILENSLKVIPAASSALFMMIDPNTRKWVSKAQIGFKDSIYQITSDIEEGITGTVYREGKGKIYEVNTPAFEETVRTLSLENARIFAESSHYSGFAKRTIAVPVTMKEDRIGVLLVYQYKDAKLLNESDLIKLQGFADQAAIAISNARMVSELIETNGYLVIRNEIHNLFTQLSMDSRSLPEMIQAVEKNIGLPTRFVDLTKQEWYPVQHNVPFTASELDQTLGKNLEPVILDSDGPFPYYIFPVHNGPLLAGCFVVQLKRPLRPLDHDILEQGSAVVMLQLMNTYSMTEMVYRRRRDFFEELIQYREPAELSDKIQRFGLSGQKSMFVCLLHLAENVQDLKESNVFMQRLIALIEKELSGESMLLFSSHDKVTILLQAQQLRSQQQLVRKLKSLVKQGATTGLPPLYGGIGGLYSGLEQVAKSHEEASRTLLFLRKSQRAGIMQYEEMGINRLFLQQDMKEIESYIYDVLSPLRSYKYQAEELELTLRVYMENNRSMSLTAEQLHIHPNTLYTRLRKLEEILALDLNDSEDWMKVYLACHLSKIY
ncbi:sugar diacid utilization regulator [Paenibacillus sp. JGP012]|uniref:helix-turn-helix domain-containing protein n=1 Tax=Paenibacillus sp. JGP012 TaxID=2735914 RepID=UPI001608D65C|nr:helix-turn-helix domain-containing protein [Paenibacillus sp. JGP012]MBB6023214.1 sugar diacid utilization regulator [Paenibacillus sp. JGP012]